MKQILLSDFNYNLPNEKIAKFPLPNRDSSKLLVFKNNQILDHNFVDLANQLPPNAHLVFNDTKVIPARLYFFNQSGAKIEIFLLNPILPSTIVDQSIIASKTTTWKCIIGNKKKWKENTTIFSNINDNIQNLNFTANLIDIEQNTVQFNWQSNHLFNELLNIAGQIPLPPYLNRQPTQLDQNTYQTIYSQTEGAVAAPTAGLHFTKTIFQTLQNKNITHQYITLHVGAGTFLPIKTENVSDHKMHNEQIVFTKEQIQSIIIKLGNIIAVGTTSLRALESLYWFGAKLETNKNQHFFIEKNDPYQINSITTIQSLTNVLQFMELNEIETIFGETEIFIFPGYNFKIINGLITNFHQPQSTLVVLIASIIGENWKKVYHHALNNNYRFLSYGDSSLLLL